MCDIAQKRMKEKKMIQRVKAVCNVCILVVIVGIMMCIFSNDQQGAISAFLIMGIGAGGCLVFGIILEQIEPAPYKKIMEEEREYAKQVASGNRPEYSFISYLQDNGSSMEELLAEIDNVTDPGLLFNMVYLSYKESAHGERVQSKEMVQSMIWRERRRLEHEKRTGTDKLPGRAG